jgi:DNA gyrase subunit A
LIRRAESPDAAREALMRQLELSEIQARAILDMRLQRLTQLERHKVVEEHEQTLALIEELKGILASDTKLMAIIRTELLAVKEEYGDARRTEILTETTELTIEDLLADEEMVVTISRAGYIKRTHVEAYRSQRRGGKGVTGMETKEEDIVEDLFVASTHSYLLFTNRGKIHWLKVWNPRGRTPGQGQAMVNPSPRWARGGGRDVRAGARFRRRRLRAVAGSRARSRRPSSRRTPIPPRAGSGHRPDRRPGPTAGAPRPARVSAAKLGMIIRFSEGGMRLWGVAGGVKGIDSTRGTRSSPPTSCKASASHRTGVATARTPLGEYRLQGRAGKGIIDIKTGGRNGNVVAMLQVRDGDDILVVTTKGKMIRFHVSDVSSQGRNTWGVRIIDLEADDRVGSVARVDSESPAPVEAQ